MKDKAQIESEALDAARKAYWNASNDSIRACVLAAIASLRSNGFELVEVEPSDEMVSHGMARWMGSNLRDMYSTMLSASTKLFQEG